MVSKNARKVPKKSSTNTFWKKAAWIFLKPLFKFDLWFVRLCDSVGNKLKIIFSVNNLKTFFGIVFVLFGFLFLYKLPLPEEKQQVLAKEPIHASASFEKNSNNPQVVRILIPKRDIDLPVVPAKIVKGYWETSENSASHGEGSANPGTKGNVVVFAHARPNLFYNLKDVEVGEVIYIFTKDHWYKYKVGQITEVLPNNITVVAPTKKETLTLFTCSGFLDEKRLIVKAYPIDDSR